MSLLSFQVLVPSILMIACTALPMVVGSDMSPVKRELPLGAKCLKKGNVYLASSKFEIIVTMEKTPVVNVCRGELCSTPYL